MIQRNALIRVTGAFRTSSVVSLTTISGHPPITLEAERKILEYKIRKGIRFEIGDYTFETEGLESVCQLNATKALAKGKARKEMLRSWEARWQQSASCVTCTFFPSILTRKRMNWLVPDRWMTWFITGHWKLWHIFQEDENKRGC